MAAVMQTITRVAQWSPLALACLGLVIGVLFAALASLASPVLSLAALIGVVGVFLMIRYPVLGLYATALLVPIERLGRFTDDNTNFTISLMRVVGVVALGAMMANRMVTRQGVLFGLPFWLYAAYVAIGITSLGWTSDFTGTARASSTVLGNLLFFFLVVNLTRTPRDAMAAILLWLFASFTMVVYSTYDWHLGSGTEVALDLGSDFDAGAGAQTSENRFSTVWEDRAELDALGGGGLRRSMGPTSHAAVYGINLIMTIPFFLLLLRFPVGNAVRAAVVVALLGVLYNSLLTNTRAVILMVGITGLLCMWRGLFPMRRSYLIAALVLSPALLMVVPEDMYNRILDVSNYTLERSASLRIRIEYFQAGLSGAIEHFFTGVGIGNQSVIPSYLPPDILGPEKTTVHNIYLQTFLEVGIFGWLAFFAFVAVLLRMAFVTAEAHRHDPYRQQEYWFMVACQLCMISVMIFGVQVDVYQFPLKGWWLVAGITYAMYRLLPEYERTAAERAAAGVSAAPVSDASPEPARATP